MISAHNLAKADVFGSSDPIAILTLGNKEVGRTKAIDNNVNPVWKKSFKFSITRGQKDKKFTIAVYDMDITGIGDFLGQVELTGSDLLFPSSNVVIKELQQKPTLGKKGNKLVQGTIKYFIVRKLSEASARRWNLLRKQVTVAARHHFKEELIEDHNDVNKIVKMAMLCASSRQGGTVSMVRCACVLFSHALDKGYSGDGKFFKSLAECHMRTWLAEGIRAERLHLERSAEAYEEALKFMENAMDVEVWVEATFTNQLLGKNERAAQTLGTIMRRFPN